MQIKIVSRFDSSKVLYEGDFSSLRLCLQAAVKSGADLGDANLRGADLWGANLGGANLWGANLGDADIGGANLWGANLRGANLWGADLRDANLGDANLRDADLWGANLGGANLWGANLGDANLRDADLWGANLRDANLGGADLRDANLRDANLRDADLGGANLWGANFDIEPATTEQAVKALDVVAEIILGDPKRLYMEHWHGGTGWKERTCAEEATCGTTHCLAGWLQVCSTDKRIKDLAPNVAGFLCAPVAAAQFHKSNGEVLDWLKNREYAKESA